MTTFLAIDYGLKHIGLAYSEHLLATPLEPVDNNQQLIPHFRSLITKYQIQHLILGLPSGPTEPAVRAFAQKLTSEFGLPVTLHDETLSTQDAQTQLRNIGVKRSKRQNEHSVAAALILEDYLESAKLNS